MSELTVKPCACGGAVTAPADATERDITRAVNVHQDTIRHRAWRAAGGFDAKPRTRDAYEDRLR